MHKIKVNLHIQILIIVKVGHKAGNVKLACRNGMMSPLDCGGSVTRNIERQTERHDKKTNAVEFSSHG